MRKYIVWLIIIVLFGVLLSACNTPNKTMIISHTIYFLIFLELIVKTAFLGLLKSSTHLYTERCFGGYTAYGLLRTNKSNKFMHWAIIDL